MGSYRIYKAMWAAAVGEELVCDREPNNDIGRYAIAVIMKHLHLLNGPRFLAFLDSIALFTSGFAEAIAPDDASADKDRPLGIRKSKRRP